MDDRILHPGDWCFGSGPGRLRTLLGSCVAITLWHPERGLGGMCHFLLPRRAAPRPQGASLDGRYGDEAIAALVSALGQQGTSPDAYECKVFGGGNMLSTLGAAQCRDVEPCSDVACRNVRAVRQLLDDAGFQIRAAHLGGRGHRSLIFDLGSGEVLVKFAGEGATIHSAASPGSDRRRGYA